MASSLYFSLQDQINALPLADLLPLLPCSLYISQTTARDDSVYIPRSIRSAKAPVILKTFVHCSSCAGRIQRVIKKYSGMDEVLVSVDTGLILVSGRNLDASFLKWRVLSKIRKCRVDIISDGTAEEPRPPQYAAPPPVYPAYPYPYYYITGTMAGGGAAMRTWVPAPPPQHLLQYVPPVQLYARQQYMPNEAPLRFNDDNPNGCCSIQ
ncbi:unnamed protein product [Urochloa humidicola]